MKKLKKLPILLLLVIGTAGFTACETEVDVTADWEDVTVVYGLLNPATDTNWIRIERGYLGDDAASASFNEPDSLYYDSLLVILESFESNNNSLGNRRDSITLQVDYSSRELEEGTFTTEGYRLYRTTAALNDELTYRLTVRKPGTELPDARATTQLVGTSPDFRFSQPRPISSYFTGGIEWYASQNAAMYEIDVFFRYTEYDRTTGESQTRTLKLDYETITGSAAQPINGQVSSNVSRTAFYDRIAGAIPEDPNKLRFFQDMRITVWAGGEELETYVQLNAPSTGVSQARPEFPQIENGTGLFSSRTSITRSGLEFTSQFMNQFYLDPRLCDRNFAVVTGGADTCICEQVGTEYTRECL